MRRLAAGGLIDRGRTLGIRFDGRAVPAHPGDTLASALLAAGVSVVGRSFKYHRPRGVLAAGSEEPNALVTVRGAPNLKATVVEAYDGLAAVSQNRWPSLGFDLMAASDLAAPLIGAGFYYKTFMWPPSWWERVYEPADPAGRRARGAGGGRGRLREGVRVLRPAGDRGGAGRADGGACRGAGRGAGDPGGRGLPAGREAAGGAARGRGAGRGGLGGVGPGRARGDAERAADAADDGDRGLRRRDVRGARAGRRASGRGAGGPAARLLLADRGAAGGALRGGERAVDRLSGERSAGGDAGRRGAGLCQPLGGGAAAGGGVHRLRRRLADGGGPRRRRGRGGGDRRRAGRRRAAGRAVAGALRGRRSSGRAGAPASARSRCGAGGRSSGSRSTAWRSPAAGTRRCS